MSAQIVRLSELHRCRLSQQQRQRQEEEEDGEKPQTSVRNHRFSLGSDQTAVSRPVRRSETGFWGLKLIRFEVLDKLSLEFGSVSVPHRRNPERSEAAS